MGALGLADAPKKQYQAIVEALMRTASQNDEGLNVQGASPAVAAGTANPLAQVVEQELARPNGLQRIAFAMHPVLKRRLDYHAIGRQHILVVDEITTGDVPFYDLDLPEFGAVATAGRGEPIQFFSNVKRIQFPTSAYSAIQQVAYEDITIRRYPLFDRAKERVAIGIAIAEDDAILGTNGVVDIASQKGPNGTVTGTNLNRFILAELYKKIVNNQLQLGAYLMHPVQYGELLKWSANELDQVSLNKITETGMVGGYFGARLLTSIRVPKNKVFALTTADKLGRLPERKAVEVKVFDDVLRLRYAIMAWEQVGFGIFNTAGVAVASIPATV